MNGRMNGRTDGWSGTSVPAWDKRLSAMSHNVPRTKRDKRPHMGQTRRAGFRPMSAATVRRLSVIPPPSPHIDTLYATKRRNVKNIFSFPHSRRPFDRGEHRTRRAGFVASLSGKPRPCAPDSGKRPATARAACQRFASSGEHRGNLSGKPWRFDVAQPFDRAAGFARQSIRPPHRTRRAGFVATVRPSPA